MSLAEGMSLDPQYQKAIEYYELALATMEKVLKNHPNTEVFRNNLAIAREKLAETATKQRKL